MTLIPGIQLSDKGGISMTTAQFGGLIAGFVLILITVTAAAVFVTRRYSVGRFGSTSGAVKFHEEV